jgi:hypothetical protein
MKTEAREFGVDLDDPMVREALVQMQQGNFKETSPQTRSKWWLPGLAAGLVAGLGILIFYLWSLFPLEEELY